MNRRDAALHLGAAALLAGTPRAFAQTEFPAAGSTLKYVVPFVAGGLTDVMARIVGQRLAENWK